jgi:23S rRNA (adenine2503-C2)-methyltransferase
VWGGRCVASQFGGRIVLIEQRVASDGTRKLLFEVESPSGSQKGGVVEAVIIPAPSGSRSGRVTVCISSQVGCAMNCQFCFTGRMGLKSNLTTEQIVEQVSSSSPHIVR